MHYSVGSMEGFFTFINNTFVQAMVEGSEAIMI